MAEKKLVKKKKVIKIVSHGHAYVQATFNNTIVIVTDQNGDVIGWASAGPANDITILISDTHNSVIKSCLNIGMAVRHNFNDFFLFDQFFFCHTSIVRQAHYK